MTVLTEKNACSKQFSLSDKSERDPEASETKGRLGSVLDCKFTERYSYDKYMCHNSK